MNQNKNIPSKSSNKRSHLWLRRTLRLLAGIILVVFLIILFIRSPWGQSIIVDKIVDYISDKTQTEVQIDELFVTFNGNLQLNGLYLEDQKGDTLIYSKSLEADIPLWETVKGNAYGVDNLYWNGVTANIVRKDSASGFNFEFLADAFSSADSLNTKNSSNEKPIDVIIGDLNFTNFDVTFNDAVSGIKSHYVIGLLETEMETTDFKNMIFEASDVVLSDSQINVTENSNKIESSASDSSVLPKISTETISINNVKTHFALASDELTAEAHIIRFYASESVVDLKQSIFKAEMIKLQNSEVSLNMNSENRNNSQNVSQPEAFKWPKVIVDVAQINFDNNNFKYTLNNAVPRKDVFNPNAIALKDFTFAAEDIGFKDEKATLRVNKLYFKTLSGIHLKTLSGHLTFSDEKSSIENLNLKLNDLAIQGYLIARYNHINQFFNSPEEVTINTNLPQFRLAVSDLFKVQPDLKNNPYLKTLSQKQLSGSLDASGTLASIDVSNIELQWGLTTKISANGSLQNISDPELLSYDIPDYAIATSATDVRPFINEKELGVKLPENIELSGSLNGSPKSLSTNSKLTTSQGDASINGDFESLKDISFHTNLKLTDYNMGTLLENPRLGRLTMTVKSSGTGSTINTLDADLDAHISSFKLNNYTIEDLHLEADLTNGTGNMTSNYKDNNLNVELDGLVVLDSIAPEVTAEINIIGADLEALGVMQRDVKTGMDIFLNFKGNTKTFNASAIVKDGVVVYDNQSYLLGHLDAKGYVSSDSTSVHVRNKMVDINLKSNANPQTFSTSIRRHILSYFYRDERVPDTISNPVNLELEGKISQSPLLNKVFLVNVKDLDTINLSIDYDEKARHLNANISAPHINYSGNELDSLAFSIRTDKNNFDFNLGFKNISAGPLNIPRTIISGNQSSNALTLNFHAYQDHVTFVHVNTRVTGNRDRLKLTVNPDSLVFNKHQWAIPNTNEVILTSQDIQFNDFRATRKKQSIKFTDKHPNIKKNHAGVEFQNFKIREVLNYLNPDANLATGQLNGNFILIKPFEATGFEADLKVNDFNLLKTDLGQLTIITKSLQGNTYDFNAALKEGKINLDFTGSYTVQERTANLNLDLDINKFQMEALNTLSLGEIKGANGSFNGHFDVSGTTKNPKYSGALNFNNANFNIAKLNTRFTLQDETLQVDNAKLSMSNFTIRDTNGNKLLLNGEIGTKNYLNPTFNLSLNANSFKILDANKEDNDKIYGKATFNSDAKLTGDLLIPKLDAKITIGPKTEVVYVLPSSVASVEERDGIVRFVNKENPDAILTETEAQTATVKGFDISSLIKIGEEATVTIIIDENTGDNFKVSGEGDFNFSMSPNGRINLSGIYEISDGHYELNLYNLVNRKFSLADGSRVTWSGDPFNAKLDVRAIYDLETSASPLMAPQISGADPSVKSKYRQVLPFKVYLNIDGQLLQPKISFGLDMPEEEQGAIGGQVYGRVQQVNQQEGELNRQVFSLLVLNRFYPDPGSDGSTGGFATIARDNLNDAVSEQLNAFSEKILGDSGIELDFGLDSYTDYQSDSPTQRTQLDVAAQKKLFDDQLTVRVGSEVDLQGNNPNAETPLIGDVSLIYALTEDERYKLKGFRRSEFENVIDGQTIVSGIALIFTQEFNHFSELWNAIFNSIKEKKAKRKAAKKEDNQKETKSTQGNETNKN